MIFLLTTGTISFGKSVNFQLSKPKYSIASQINIQLRFIKPTNEYVKYNKMKIDFVHIVLQLNDFL